MAFTWTDGLVMNFILKEANKYNTFDRMGLELYILKFKAEHMSSVDRSKITSEQNQRFTKAASAFAKDVDLADYHPETLANHAFYEGQVAEFFYNKNQEFSGPQAAHSEVALRTAIETIGVNPLDLIRLLIPMLQERQQLAAIWNANKTSEVNRIMFLKSLEYLNGRIKQLLGI